MFNEKFEKCLITFLPVRLITLKNTYGKGPDTFLMGRVRGLTVFIEDSGINFGNPYFIPYIFQQVKFPVAKYFSHLEIWRET